MIRIGNLFYDKKYPHHIYRITNLLNYKELNGERQIMVEGWYFNEPPANYFIIKLVMENVQWSRSSAYTEREFISKFEEWKCQKNNIYS